MTRDDYREGSATATGKLILSGEHAVVFGAPALAMGTRCRVRTRMTSTGDARVTFDLPAMEVHLRFSAEQLKALHQRSLSQYRKFINGEITIDQVLNHSVELIPFAFAAAWNHLGCPDFAGVCVDIEFGIPVGCGMGSSAAVGISVLKAVGHYFKTPIEDGAIFRLSMQCERLMHGHPSGVDSSVSLHGGAFRFQNGTLEPRPLPTWSFQLFNSGRPESSTGECVESVRSRFTEDDPIWQEFAAVTEALDAMFETSAPVGLLDCIRRNHHLLCRIGVVPQRVQRAIGHIESLGGAAKITGAGAVRGDNAGALIVFGDVAPHELKPFGIEPIEGC